MNDTTAPTSEPKRRGNKRPLLDYPFIPKPTALLQDTRVSHPAYRLWDAIYDCQWRRVAPTMTRLQAAMLCDGKPATRRSVERWLTELEGTGWLEWRRGAPITERYHLKTGVSAASGPDSTSSAIEQVQALLRAGISAEALRVAIDTIVESQNTIVESYDTIVGSHDATPGSEHVIVESQNTILRSYPTLSIERSGDQDQTSSDTTPTHHPDDGDDDPVVRYLQGLGITAAQEFRGLDLQAVQERVSLLQQDPNCRPGAIVKSLRASPPQPSLANGSNARLAELNARYGDLFRSGDDVSDLVDLEEPPRARAAGE